MILDVQLKDFLEARTMLPNPDRYKQMVFTISIGASMPAVKSDVYLYREGESRTFTFKKCFSCLERGTKYDWVCTDMSLQHIIFENQIFASLMLHKVSVTA